MTRMKQDLVSDISAMPEPLLQWRQRLGHAGIVLRALAWRDLPQWGDQVLGDHLAEAQAVWLQKILPGKRLNVMMG